MGRPRSSDPTEAFPLRMRGSLLARIREAAGAKKQTPAAWIAEACEDSLDAVTLPPSPEGRALYEAIVKQAPPAVTRDRALDMSIQIAHAGQHRGQELIAPRPFTGGFSKEKQAGRKK